VNAAKVMAEVVTPGAYWSRQVRIRPSTSAERAVSTVRPGAQGRVGVAGWCGGRAKLSPCFHRPGLVPNCFHQAFGSAHRLRSEGAITAARSSPAARTSSRRSVLTGPASPYAWATFIAT
jgi:hypothetical protein